GRRLASGVGRRAKPRSRRRGLAVAGRHALGEGAAVVLPAAVELDVEEGTEKRPDRVIRRGRLALLAAERDLLHVGAVVAELVGQTRLADARFPDELDHRPEAHADGLDGCAEHRALALALDEWELPTCARLPLGFGQ